MSFFYKQIQATESTSLHVQCAVCYEKHTHFCCLPQLLEQETSLSLQHHTIVVQVEYENLHSVQGTASIPAIQNVTLESS